MAAETPYAFGEYEPPAKPFELAEVISAEAPAPALCILMVGALELDVTVVPAVPEVLERPRMSGSPAAALAGDDDATPIAAAPARVVAPAAIMERRLLTSFEASADGVSVTDSWVKMCAFH